MTHPSSGDIARPDPAAEAGAAEALAAGRHGDPFSVLGPHPAGDGHVVRAWLPGAERAVLRRGDGRRAPMERVHEAGVFAVGLAADPGAYRIEAARGAATWEVDDPYRFGPVIGEMDEHLISEGTHLRLWEVLGARTTTHQGASGTAFAVWAPNAERVSVIGPFNDWDGRRHPMRRRGASGVWEIFLPGIGAGERYKYEIIGPGGELLPPKADPVGRASELRPDNCSVVPSPVAARPAGDAGWRAARGARVATDAPVSIYEVHLGSWRRGEGGRWLSYEELADRLVAHVAGMGFTHIELLPVTEHPFDGSWGYQPVGLYAPTRRFGPPEAFHAFVDACHAAGIGVILDWVPAHFPSDPHGLGRFDGTHLYEHSDPREGFHRDWDTLIYNFGRREVQNFLVANALYWTQEMGIDGLRVDAVASMLYRDYSREDGEWVPNRHGGRENLEAIDFLRRMNAQVYGADPSLVTIAEESTAWPGVSRPVHHGGLGFGYKWNMGWMHDTLDYMGRDPMYRAHHHGLMSFGLHYAFSENFVLPLSHDEVVHGKGSILGRMPGDRWQKFANLRAYYAFMYAHPGKKLLFMGQEFGQESEWNHDAELPWDAFREPLHEGVSALVHDLNRLYRERPALHRRDCREDGFEWIDGAAEQASVYAWTRRGEDGDPPVLCVFNFSGVEHAGWRLGVPRAGRWAEVLNSDATVYGGAGRGNMGGADSEPVEAHGRPDSIALTLPPLTGIILEHRP